MAKRGRKVDGKATDSHLTPEERDQVNAMIDRALKLLPRCGFKSERALATELGLAANRITRRKDVGCPNALQIHRMARALGTTTEYLITGEGSSLPAAPEGGEYALVLAALKEAEIGPVEAIRRLISGAQPPVTANGHAVAGRVGYSH